jgi:hypothetical protein
MKKLDSLEILNDLELFHNAKGTRGKELVDVGSSNGRYYNHGVSTRSQIVITRI